jgi:hypothetical protein
MRKLCTLLAGLVLAIMILPANARTLTPDIANFTFTVDALTNNVSFINTSVIGNEPGVRRAHWSFGDGSDQWTGASDGAQHHYQSGGTYTVCLKIVRINSNTNDSTISSDICKTVVIESVCHAGFETVASTANQLGKYFIARPSHTQNKKPVRICWKFGDNSDTCIQYSTTYTGTYGVFHQYSQPAYYNVCVDILYDGGCEAQNCHYVPVNGPDSCHADFEMLASNSSAHGKYFVAQPWHNNNKKPVRVCWTFGDNTDTCIQYTTAYTGAYAVFHQYTQSGNYNVCVNILYDGGCEANNCRTIHAGELPDTCRADFERIPFTSANNVLTAGFRALTWHNNNKKPSRICWTFGDNRDTCITYGQDYSGQYLVSHTCPHRGQYEVCVKILYFGGCEAMKCRVIEVNNPDSCRADFERIPVSSTNNVLTAIFHALPWNNSTDKKPSRICWTFGDNRDTCINYGQDYNGSYVVNHTYQQAGQYEVCVKILYYGGCEAIKCKVVPIPGENHCAVTVFELTPSVNSLTRILYAAVTSVPPHPVQSICWNFGDGTDTCITATTATTPPLLLITHTYPGPGVYHACVRVVFQGGCVAENCKGIVIRSNSHLCGGYMTDSLTGIRTIKFKAFAIHNPNDPVVSYRWNFGDGSIANGPEVTHTYNIGGEYRVCLNILTQSGCETRICNTVRVPGANQAILQLSPNPVVNVLHALFLSNHNENMTIRIVNSSGVIVRTYTRYANIGINNWDFDLSALLPGTYLFTVQSPNQLASAIFMKQ